MQVKVFEAKDMATGLKMVKEALGPDALILSTRTIRNGKFGMLGKPMMEITAAVDNGWQPPKTPAPKTQQADIVGQWSSPQRERYTQPQRHQPQEEISYQEIWSRRGSERFDYAAAEAQSRDIRDKSDLQQELAELRTMVKGLTHRLGGFDAETSQRPYVDPEFIAAPATTTTDPVAGLLTACGVHAETAQVVSRFTRDTIEKSPTLTRLDLHRILKDAIARLFTTTALFTGDRSTQRRISLVGPTGVGKTTTLAKIAAHFLSHHGGRIGLITIDTYRIAAVEQLKVYGEIMRLPLEVVITQREMEQALEKFRTFDLVLIDTAGRSPRSGLDIQELAGFLKPQFGIENNLMLSAATRERELEETIRRFSLLPISNFIFSKIDECDQLGVLLNIHYKNDTPISFLTNGQRVPEDLLIPSPADIAELILNDHGHPTHG
jgi:flagellar biosynthesis protein FlhF